MLDLSRVAFIGGAGQGKAPTDGLCNGQPLDASIISKQSTLDPKPINADSPECAENLQACACRLKVSNDFQWSKMGHP